MKIKWQNICFFIALVLAIIVSQSSCVKEYSYEGSITDTLINADTGVVNETVFDIPTCISCMYNEFADSAWSFIYNSKLLCGYITRGVMSPDTTAFTFFGPSKCSLDTGLVMTVFFNNIVFNKDYYQLKSDKTILEYYDNVHDTDLLISGQPLACSLTIEEFHFESRYMKGRFAGYVYAKNGSKVSVADGKFAFYFDK